jgi:hypothetical protein
MGWERVWGSVRANENEHVPFSSDEQQHASTYTHYLAYQSALVPCLLRLSCSNPLPVLSASRP